MTRRRTLAATVAAAAAVVAGLAVAEPASAARLAETDVSVSIAGVNNLNTTIGMTLKFTNEGPLPLTDTFQVFGIARNPGRMTLTFGSPCTTFLNSFTCTLGAIPTVGGVSTKTLEFGTPDGCGAGCDIEVIIEDRFGSRRPDLNPRNDEAQIEDGRIA